MVNAQILLFDKGRPSPQRFVYPREFELWWNLYQRHVAKRKTFDSFVEALKVVSWEELMRKTMVLMETSKAKGQYCPHPTTFLNQHRWDDDPREWADDRGRVNAANWDYRS